MEYGQKRLTMYKICYKRGIWKEKNRYKPRAFLFIILACKLEFSHT